MDTQELADFYKGTYSHAELAALLASHVVDGSLPALPENPAQVPASAGRPSREVFQAKKDRLADLLAKVYPDVVDLATLSAQTGIGRAALQKLQHNPDFALDYGRWLGLYFKSLPLTGTSRLSPLLRVALDLHNYYLLLNNPGQKLPLYTWHATLFGKPLVDGKQISTYNARERGRALDVVRGWEVLDPPEFEYDRPAITDCIVTGCPLCLAYRDGVDLTYIDALRRAIGPLPWGVADRLFISGTTYAEILQQVVGA